MATTMTKGKTRGNAAVLGTNQILKKGGKVKTKKYAVGGESEDTAVTPGTPGKRGERLLKKAGKLMDRAFSKGYDTESGYNTKQSTRIMKRADRKLAKGMKLMGEGYKKGGTTKSKKK